MSQIKTPAQKDTAAAQADSLHTGRNFAKGKVYNFLGFPQPEQADPKTVSSRKTASRTHILTPGPLFEGVVLFHHVYPHTETHSLATCSRIWEDLLGRQSMSRKEMCLKLSKTELQGDGCTPVGISRREKCQIFRDFLNQNKSCELHKTASMTHILTL
jgi:hypothetical protein